MSPTATGRIRVLLADDHPVVLGGLRAAIQKDQQLEVIAEATTAEATVESVTQLCPNVAIIDLNLPRMNGIAAIRKIRERETPTRILVLTAHDTDSLFHGAMEAGANGYLLKESAFSEIVSVIHVVCEGGCYVPAHMLRRLLQHQPADIGISSMASFLRDLSPVERRILSLVAQKKSSKEIAAEFVVSERTIENRRNTICEKLGLNGVNSLLKFALEHRSELR